MRSEDEVRAMMAKFELAEAQIARSEDPDDTAVDGILDALIWFMGETDDQALLGYLPEDVE